MAAQITVTAKTGPGNQVTSQVFLNVTKLNFDFEKKVVQVDRIGNNGPTYSEFDMVGVTTITDTITAGNHVMVLS